MTGGGLYDPLGTAAIAVPPRRRPSGKLITAGVVVAALAILGIAVAFRGGDERGEPHAVVPIERLPAQASSAPSPSAPPAVSAPVAPSPPLATAPGPVGPAASGGDADVEIQNGVKIIRMHPAPARSPTPPTLPPPSPATAPAPGRPATKDATQR